MRLLVIYMAMFFGVVFNISSAQAAAPEWVGTQYWGIVGGEAAMTDQVSARASLHYFWVPSSDLELVFVYAGPKFAVADWFWTAPQVGTVSGWFGAGDDGFVLSTWNGLTLGAFTAFIEVDGYFSPGSHPCLYGYYSFDANGAIHYDDLEEVPVNFGVQIEEVDTAFIFGPHLGFSKGPFHWEAQYYLGGPPEMLASHAARFLFAIGH